jgi:hypothetical protein
MNTNFVVIPRGMTSRLQVLVVGNKPFQDDLKQLFSEELFTGDHALTPADRSKKPSVILLCQWIVIALQHISPEMTVECFTKCCVSNAVDGTYDHMLWNDSEVEGKVRSECEEDEGTD